MAQSEKVKVAEIRWEGDSYDVLMAWPKAQRVDFGHALREMQEGRPAKLAARSMSSIGSGVFELKDEDDKTWYRMIYLARKEDVIYVLHCFEKDSRKTSQRDINTATTRLSQVIQRLMEERKHAKRK